MDGVEAMTERMLPILSTVDDDIIIQSNIRWSNDNRREIISFIIHVLGCEIFRSFAGNHARMQKFNKSNLLSSLFLSPFERTTFSVVVCCCIILLVVCFSIPPWVSTVSIYVGNAATQPMPAHRVRSV